MHKEEKSSGSVAHFTPDTNKWVAEEILKEYTERSRERERLGYENNRKNKK